MAKFRPKFGGAVCAETIFDNVDVSVAWELDGITFAAPGYIDWRGHVGGLVTGTLVALVQLTLEVAHLAPATVGQRARDGEDDDESLG